MPGNESVTDNMKSFVGGVALKQAFYNIKTYNEQAISTAVTTHNADAAHRHLPIAPTAATTAASGLASLNFLTNSSTPEWKTLPLATGYTTNSDDTLATGKAVKTAYDTLNTNIGKKLTIEYFTWTYGDTSSDLKKMVYKCSEEKCSAGYGGGFYDAVPNNGALYNCFYLSHSKNYWVIILAGYAIGGMWICKRTNGSSYSVCHFSF